MKSSIQKAMAFLCSTCFCMSTLPQITLQTTAAQSVETVNNIVLFAQFDTTEGYNFMDGHTDEMIQMCNDSSTVFSLSGYVQEISYGQMETTCYFPQLEGDTIVPYTMSQSEDSYANNDLVCLEVLNHVTISEDMPLDGNHDGVIDNIILVVDASEEAMGDQFWPSAFSLGGTQINGVYTGMVNIQTSKSLFVNYISGGAGVLCHEFLHSIGYPDLYHSTNGTGVPVGQWDIMASNSIYVQYPLAYMRATVSNWLETTDITEDGTYVLQPASSDSGNRVYLLKTPLSDTEFFAVEFRQKGEAYSKQMDTKIYGTGMVVYRVNTEVSGNHNSDKDQIYVFRPEETTLNASAGNLYQSNYGGTDRANSIGSLDFSDGIAEGALVYSDGTNSGIQIRNITIQDDDTLSFDVQFAETDATQLWQSVSGASALSANSALALQVTAQGTPYLLTSDGSTAQISQYQDGVLTTTSSSIGSGGYGSVNNAKLATIDNTLYVLYNDSEYRYVLCAYDADTKKWNTQLRSDALAQYTDLVAANGKLYLSYTTGIYPYALHTLCYDPETQQTTELGDTLAENACNLSMATTGDTIAVAYRDLNDSSKPKIAIWNGTDWTTSTLAEQSCGTVSITANDTAYWVTATGDGAGFYCWEDGEITETAFPETDGSCFSALPLVSENGIYLAINTQNPDDFSLYQLKETGWISVGNAIASEVVNNAALASDGNHIFVAYTTTNGTTLVKRLDFQTETNTKPETILLGDVNQDGSVDVADIVSLQHYLLQDAVTTNISLTHSDLYSDQQINILDLLLLKRQILQASF